MSFRNQARAFVAAVVALVALLIWADSEVREAKRACYALGYEFVDGNYFGGTTYCAEKTGATRKVITIQR